MKWLTPILITDVVVFAIYAIIILAHSCYSTVELAQYNPETGVFVTTNKYCNGYNHPDIELGILCIVISIAAAAGLVYQNREYIMERLQ